MTSESWLMRRLRGGLPRVQAITRPWSIESPGQEHRHVVHAPAKRVVVCGDDPLAHRLIAELIQQYGVQVTAIMPSVRGRHGPEIAQLLADHGGRVVEADKPDIDAFRKAELGSADALALVRQDDIGNLDAALQAQEIHPGLRLVIRMFNLRLGQRVRRNFADVRVLSDAQMAAPAFVSEALGEVAPVHVRVAGRTLFVARRAEVRADDVVCGLARTVGAGEPDLLPADQERADLVLAVATGERAATVLPRDERGELPRRNRGRLRRWLRRQRHRPFATLRSLISRKLWVTALLLVGLLAAGTAIIAYHRHISWWDAAYVTLLSELIGASPDLQAHWLEKLVTTLLSLVSIALIPVITAAVVDAVVKARLAIALGRLREPLSDHVVVVGLGNVGTRVMHSFVDLGVPVVAIDRDDNARGAQSARERNVPFIVGDASNVETLRAASVDTCRALVVVSTDDQANLEAAIEGRELNPDLRVILRLFDGGFASRVQRAFGITASRSVSYLAAPAFAAALLEREVIGTIPVDRRVLLLAEVPVIAASELDGRPVAVAQDVGEVRVLSVTTEEGRQTVWAPPATYVLRADDLLTVVTTRTGLGNLLAQTGGTVDGSR
ncbi:NAD-binding protein [Dactylosporangium sucinum]|uniref:Potassium transporter TrkA n=1 Tax=Dactylosporangium sucinum TaxID=1424081 RepID=A0A917WUE9_9ACTN|nr:NAD-binding protein [Dactylosporangium sucinum]GGM33274.1 potassium transporter TrkA [Dactylosporangium sucinum]